MSKQPWQTWEPDEDRQHLPRDQLTEREKYGRGGLRNVFGMYKDVAIDIKNLFTRKIPGVFIGAGRKVANIIKRDRGRF